ncbi:MAG: AAA family ATPase [Bacteroidota bacterium]
MTKEDINKVIEEELFQKIIHEKDFYFLKGQEALQRWLDFQVSDQLKEDIIRLSTDYTQFQEIAEIEPEVGKIKDILFTIISYCDIRAKDKAKYNQYEDNRTLAEASVRMGNWVDGLVKYKFKHSELTSTSIANAMDYLLYPLDNCPILSEKMRKEVIVNFFQKPYKESEFVEDMKSFFHSYKLSISNPENYTFLLSNLVYEFQDEWKESVIGLMASDGTGWHKEELSLDSKFSGLITWNSKKPSGGAETLKFLREIVTNGETFPLYVSSKNQVRYRIDVRDFVTSQQELDNADWGNEQIKYYHKNFSDYKDENKSAYIVFLADSISKLEPKPVEDFVFFKSYVKPTQDNLSPIKRIKEKDIEIETSKNSNSATSGLPPLNQIFFGPPGTGKTYHTINEALRIVGMDINGKTREEVKEEFDKKVQSGQIVFTTFHQSLNYEEFIEGIKPSIVNSDEENQKLDYHVNPGIFKKLSIEASFDLAKSQMSKETEETLDFSNLYDMFVEQVEEKLLNDETVEIKTKSGGTVIIDSVSEKGNIIVKHPNGTREYIVSKARLTKLNNAFDNLDAVSNINDEFRGVIGGSNSSAYWSVLNAIKQINKKVKVKVQEKAYSFTDKVEVVKKMTREEYRTSTGKNFVLIIDEINRGNVSQIFGELITLIEKDKRLGKDEDLKVTLPYSGDKFGVPPNLYIIGTMNTADRSVEALDTALRRRFSFREMPPKPELLSPKEMILRLWNEDKFSEALWTDPIFRQKADALYRLLGIDSSFEKPFHKEESLPDSIWGLEDLENVFDEKFKGVNLESFLTKINSRIGILLDTDHYIGHSYFLGTTSWESLIEAMYRNIIPLLQEYFYGDYAKIGAILGSGFVKKEEVNTNSLFAFGYEEVEGSKEVIYKFIDYRKEDGKGLEGFKNAIEKLINNPIKTALDS